jgi:hypothetical protein
MDKVLTAYEPRLRPLVNKEVGVSTATIQKSLPTAIGTSSVALELPQASVVVRAFTTTSNHVA